MKRLQSCRLASCAKTTDIPMSGSAVKSHDWPRSFDAVKKPDFADWNFELKAFVGNLNQCTWTGMHEVEWAQDPLPYGQYDDEWRQLAPTIHVLLTMYTEGTPPGIVHKVSNRNGFESYRRLPAQPTEHGEHTHAFDQSPGIRLRVGVRSLPQVDRLRSRSGRPRENSGVGTGTCTQSMTIPSYLPLEMHLQSSLTKRSFKAGSWISKQEFAQKRRISRSYRSGSRDRSNQLAEGPHQSKINYGKRFLWSRITGFDDGGRIEMRLRCCWFDLRNYRENLTPSRRLKNVRDACSFLHTHATGDREDNVGWSGETQEILTWSKHTLQYRKWRQRLTWKAWTVQRPVLRRKFLVYGRQDEQDRRVIIDILPCVVVKSLETVAFMAVVAYFDILTVKGNPARIRKEEGTQGAVAILNEKNNVQGCVSQDSEPMNSILR